MISEQPHPIVGSKVREERSQQPFQTQDRRYSPPPVKKGRFVTMAIIAVLVAGLGWFVLRPTAPKAPPMTATATAITTDSATITWNTTQPVSSQVEYGITTEHGLLSTFSASRVRSHSVTLTGLTPGTTYDYSALSTDAKGKVAKSANGTFTTHGSANGAVSSGAVAMNITAMSATITWSTDQPLTSQVEYGPTAAYGSLSAFNAIPMTSHSVTLTGLKTGIAYNFSALSANSSGQVTKSPNGTFTTTSVAGTPVVSEAHAESITATSAKINWTTDQPCTSQVEYGPTPAAGSLSAFVPALATGHSLALNGLKPGTTYTYVALSVNSTGQVGKSASATFTTAAMGSGPLVSNVSGTGGKTGSATISWTTDQASSSQVEYGISSAHGSLSGFNAARVTSHSVTLNGLIPGSTYNFTALSTSESGAVGKSEPGTFTAGTGPPVISQVTLSNITPTTAIVTWVTDQPTTSQVEFASTSLLWSFTHRHHKIYTTKSSLDSTLTKTHSVKLTGLTPGTMYDYAAASENSGGMDNLSANLRLVTAAAH